MNKTIQGIIAAVLLIAGFVGGMQYGKSATPAPTQSQFGQGSGRMGRFGGAGLTAGQILSIDQSSITVKMQDGSSKIILLGHSTAVQKSVSGTTADLIVGQNVAVQGTPNSDGSVTAQNIQIRPQRIASSTPSAAQY